MSSPPQTPRAVSISGVTHAGMCAQSQCNTGLSSGPKKISFTRVSVFLAVASMTQATYGAFTCDASTAFCQGRPLRAYGFECRPGRRVLKSLHCATFETVNSVRYPEQRRLVGDDEDRHRVAQLLDGRAD